MHCILLNNIFLCLHKRGKHDFSNSSIFNLLVTAAHPMILMRKKKQKNTPSFSKVSSNQHMDADLSSLSCFTVCLLFSLPWFNFKWPVLLVWLHLHRTLNHFLSTHHFLISHKTGQHIFQRDSDSHFSHTKSHLFDLQVLPAKVQTLEVT